MPPLGVLNKKRWSRFGKDLLKGWWLWGGGGNVALPVHEMPCLWHFTWKHVNMKHQKAMNWVIVGWRCQGHPSVKKKIKGLGILCALRHWSGNEMPDKQSL